MGGGGGGGDDEKPMSTFLKMLRDLKMVFLKSVESQRIYIYIFLVVTKCARYLFYFGFVLVCLHAFLMYFFFKKKKMQKRN